MYTGDKNMINVAIDGPAGAGKSTISRAAADKLGFIYVDTGALYRSVGVYALRNGINTKSGEQLKKALPDIKVELVFEDGVQHVYLNGEDVSEEIRTPKASMAASDVSAVPEVRCFLFDLQRDIAVKNNCIMDGRDIGTVVLPNADVKIFLTASPESRAMRRYKELKEKGASVGYDEVLADLKERDYNDSHRKIAPLKPAKDSITVDTTLFTLEESIKKITDIIREHM
jgi:cytidylate kinase